MKWVLLDLSYIAHRARYALGDLEHDDIPVGVLYGFFEQLYSICTNPIISSNRVLIFADSKRSYRARAFPDYKKKRKEERTEEEQQQISIMYQQVNKLKNKILPKIGFPVFKQVGLESDDLIAYVAQEINAKDEKGIIITSDGDLYQCITPYIQWYDPGKELLLDVKSFTEKKGISPAWWGTIKAMGGCNSDGVPGLKGIGEKSAIDYMTGKLSEHTKKYQTIVTSDKEIERWGKLTILPHKKTKPFSFHPPQYNSRMFFKFCKHYNIMSYLEPRRQKQWLNFFKGVFKGKLKMRKRK